MSPKFFTQKIVSKISKNLDDFRIPVLLPPPQGLLIHYSSEKHKNYLKLSCIFNSLWKKNADHRLGMRSENDGISIGNAPITFEGDHFFWTQGIITKNTWIVGTQG